jgi:hypothetical protein
MPIKKPPTWDNPKIIAKYKAETINGVSFTLFKMALRKFMLMKELSLGLGTLEILKHITEQKMRSNLLNKMILSMTEDVNIHNPMLPITMKELYIDYKNTGDFTNIKNMYILLYNSDKCRIIHDIKATYALSPYYISDLKFFENTHAEMAPEYAFMYKFTYTQEETLDFIKEKLIDRSYDVFIYLSYYIRKKYIALSGAQKIWRILNKIADPSIKDIIESLRFFYVKFTITEKIYYLYHAILLVINIDKLILTPVIIPSEPGRSKCPLIDNKFPEYISDDNIDIIDESTVYKNPIHRNYQITFKHLLSIYNENELGPLQEESAFSESVEETVSLQEEYYEVQEESE